MESDLHPDPGGQRQVIGEDGLTDLERLDLRVSLSLRDGHHLPPERIAPVRVLDAGCFTGLSTLDYVRLWPRATVYGVDIVEPNLEMARGRVPEATFLNRALWDMSGTVHYPTHPSTNVTRVGDHGTPVEAVSLAALLRDLAPSPGLTFVKLDVEGEELRVLSATDGWEWEVQWLLVDVHDFRTCVEDVRALLHSRGYDSVEHSPWTVWAWRA